MSIAGALSNALSGLQYASRAAELASNNVANALNEGYARRELQVSSRDMGNGTGGVWVTGVTRVVDPVLLADRRLAEAASGNRDTRAAYFDRIETALGSTADGALLDRIAAFDTALTTAASRPESDARLTDVLDAAQALTESINSAAKEVQATRESADAAIASDVDQLNTALQKIADLNRQITEHFASGRDLSGLQDQRQKLVDQQISSMVPVREVQRDFGKIALFTTNGAVLLDGLPSEFGFTPHSVIVPQMSEANGLLSGLTLNGRSISTDGSDSLIAGGSLAANFSIRDDLAPAAQTRLDALARDLVERFADPAVDPTLATGAAGLFTDGWTAFDPTDEVGLSERLSVNAAVDPDQGGLLRLLRDGIGSSTAGPVGSSTLLTALQEALTVQRVPASGFTAEAQSFAGLATELLSGVATARLNAESEASFASSRWESLRVLELENGVDTDQEMQQMLLIEQAYAANAKVMQSVDEMINTLLEM